MVSGLKFVLTGLVPELWPFILAILVVAIVIYLPNGFSDGAKVFGSITKRLVSAPHRKLQP